MHTINCAVVKLGEYVKNLNIKDLQRIMSENVDRALYAEHNRMEDQDDVLHCIDVDTMMNMTIVNAFFAAAHPDDIKRFQKFFEGLVNEHILLHHVNEELPAC